MEAAATAAQAAMGEVCPGYPEACWPVKKDKSTTGHIVRITLASGETLSANITQGLRKGYPRAVEVRRFASMLRLPTAKRYIERMRQLGLVTVSGDYVKTTFHGMALAMQPSLERALALAVERHPKKTRSTYHPNMERHAIAHAAAKSLAHMRFLNRKGQWCTLTTSGLAMASLLEQLRTRGASNPSEAGEASAFHGRRPERSLETEAKASATHSLDSITPDVHSEGMAGVGCLEVA